MTKIIFSIVNWLGCAMLATRALLHTGPWTAETAAHFLIALAVACDLWLTLRARKSCPQCVAACVTASTTDVQAD